MARILVTDDEAIQAGAKDFIVKPFQGPRVLNAMNKAVGVGG